MSNIVQWAMNLPSGYITQTMLVILDGIDGKIVPSLSIVAKRFEPHLKLAYKRYADYNTKEKCVVYMLRIIYTIDHFGESEIGKCVIKISNQGVDIKGIIEIDCEDTRIKSVELPLIREAIQSYKIFIHEHVNEMIRKLSDQIYQEQKSAPVQQPKIQPFEEKRTPNPQQDIPPLYNIPSPMQDQLPIQPPLNLQSSQNPPNQNVIDPRTLKNAMNRIIGSPNGVFVPNTSTGEDKEPIPKENSNGEFNLANIMKDNDEEEEFPKPKVPNRAFQIRVPDPNTLRTSNI